MVSPASNACGSSPRPRGTQSDGFPRVLNGRIIPASAGNTATGHPRCAARPDHPRVRGEHTPIASAKAVWVGSSPRPRGTHDGTHRDARIPRIIPASAGNTRFPGRCSRWRPDHPRVRGEHDSSGRMKTGECGSSPRPRGTRLKGNLGVRAGRIIPASAGNTCRHGPRPWSGSDHPRVRGEHTMGRTETAAYIGSSPRPRGTLSLPATLSHHDRIIPASAGNTSMVQRYAHLRPDHPRVRGEHTSIRLTGLLQAGSSPRPRGTRQNHRHDQTAGRIIPASAGNTSCDLSLADAAADHPRVRGEHVTSGDESRSMSGSSPRPRGTPHDQTRGLRGGRIIPASAGNTR